MKQVSTGSVVSSDGANFQIMNVAMYKILFVHEYFIHMLHLLPKWRTVSVDIKIFRRFYFVSERYIQIRLNFAPL